MADTLSRPQRSQHMALIKGRDTNPERVVRRIAHALGYRFRLHRRELPGTPDVVFPSRRKVIWVHGCFWHGHQCKKGRLPKSRLRFWVPKIEGNKARDLRNQDALVAMGWKFLVLWQCELNDRSALAARLKRFLGKPGQNKIKLHRRQRLPTRRRAL